MKYVKQLLPIDKNGRVIKVGDIVTVEVYEPKLRQTGVSVILGRVVLWNETWPQEVNVSIGEGLTIRARQGNKLEVIDNAEDLLAEQLESQAPYLMLTQLESII